MAIDEHVKRLGNPDTLVEALKAAGSPGFSNFTAADFLRGLNLVLKNEEYRALFFKHISAADLVGLLKEPPVSLSYFETLQLMMLLPTPKILSFVFAAGTDAKSDLEGIINGIHSGGFNPSDRLHLELEYSRYATRFYSPFFETTIPFPYCDMPFESFAKLPFLDGQEVILTDRDYREAEKTAKEALSVLNFVKGKVSPAVPLMVIGNMRYGSLFVVKPIEDYLAELGVKVVHDEYVSSSDFDRTDKRVGDISKGTLDWIAENAPNVIVVDGTSNNHVFDEWEVGKPIDDAVRFPAAMLGYIYAFRDLNRYHELKVPHYELNFWAPEMRERVFVGEHEVRYKPVVGDGSRELTIVCSTSLGPESSHGYFDNPEKRARRFVLGFTSSGLKWRMAASTDDFVEAVQQHMKVVIAELLR
ncbi:hypothetical protein HYU16_01785 [Candidatus Woesearchaeota archaeon]|nr:hypothetical protein [Candidatus Woesearchaeota archaeon]MBI2550159.1 hypothetical protein [Candidatus Woesearchaeota archaeon]